MRENMKLSDNTLNNGEAHICKHKISTKILASFRCYHCNPDHNKFSSLSNTTVVAMFPKLCLWRRSLCSNLGGIGLEKLYRATLRKNYVRIEWICKDLPKQNIGTFNMHEIYFEWSSVTVSTIYCFNPKLRLFFVRNWVLLYINENGKRCT